MNIGSRKQRGFSLVELAIVILIMGLVLGGLAMPLSVQRENARVLETKDLIDTTEETISGFALANDHLPCPATPSSNGLAATAGGVCVVQHGFVPATTLGLGGPRNDDGLLLDSWASPIRYSVSAVDVDADGNWDFTSPGEMRDVTMANLLPDLTVCTTAAGATASSCANPASTLTSGSPAVVFSMGKDWGSFTSPDQSENVGANLGGGPSGANYGVAGNIVFVSRRMSAQSGSEYDDIVRWTSALQLYNRLVAGGRLP